MRHRTSYFKCPFNKKRLKLVGITTLTAPLASTSSAAPTFAPPVALISIDKPSSSPTLNGTKSRDKKEISRPKFIDLSTEEYRFLSQL